MADYKERKEYKMKKGLAITIISVLAIAAVLFGVLYFTNNSQKTKEIEGLRSESAEKSTWIEQLNSDIEEKKNFILNTNLNRNSVRLIVMYKSIIYSFSYCVSWIWVSFYTYVVFICYFRLQILQINQINNSVSLQISELCISS